jgi:putative ABC transport system permease protein
MAWLRRTLNIFRSRRLDTELDEELAFHVAERTDDLIARGLTPEEASREARRRFGNYSSRLEETRDMDIARSLEAFLEDLRYGARQLRLNPGFAAVAVLSLALGIGANSGIFQLINALRLRSLPVPDPGQLAAVVTAPDFYGSGWFDGRHSVFTYAQLEQVSKHQEALSSLLAFGTARFNLSRGGEARYAEGLYVTPNFLQVLGVAPYVGHWLAPDTDPRDCSGAGALLNHAFWQSEFGGDPEAVGRTLTLNGHSLPILGVMPPSFAGLEPARRFDVALPLCADGIFAGNGPGRLANKTAWWLTPLGRLKPGWSVERASTHFGHISPLVFRATQPEAYRPDAIERYLQNRFRVVPARAGVSSVRRNYENPLWILLASTGLVLLIACANLANLLLARASAREREMALRQAVGASRGRLVAQLMSESLLLAGLGAAVGAWVAFLLSHGLVLFLGSSEQYLTLSLGVDWRVVGFTAALAVATCALFGLAPALRATTGAPADAMRGGRGSTSSPERQGMRRALVVSQIALSLVLLVGALLFGQSLRNLLETETGIDSDGVLVARIDATLSDLEPERRLGVFRQLTEGLNALPDVTSAAAVRFAPFSGQGWNQDIYADVEGDRSDGEAWFNRVGPGYFSTMKTPLFAGREFGPHDGPGAPQVAVVNEQFARELFDDRDPIGRTFRYEASAGETDPTYQIVGLVKNTKYGGLREEQRAIAFLPVAQDEVTPGNMSFVVRARGSFSSVMAGIKSRMAETDGGLLVEFNVLDLQMSGSILRERLMAHLSGGFGLLAALLSALGLYGVMSYMVVRRRNEIGIRMALGAERRDIRRMVLAEAGRLVGIGLAVGLVASIALSRYAESLLFGLQANDATTLALGCGLLATTALVAALMPVQRATSVDPAVVLRDE